MSVVMAGAKGMVNVLGAVVGVCLGAVVSVVGGALLALLLVVVLLYVLATFAFIKKRDYSKNASLRTMRLRDGSRQLLRPLVVTVTVKGGAKVIKIPAGFRTDYSSIPTVLQWFVLWSKVDVAGVVHDWLYRAGGMDRKDADKIWRDIAMTGVNRATKFQAQGCYVAGLRIGARFTWCCYRKKYPVIGKGKGMKGDLIHRIEAIENMLTTLKSDKCTLQESLSEIKDLLKKCCDESCKCSKPAEESKPCQEGEGA